MISPNIVIITKEELKAREDRAYQRGVMRGRFEASSAKAEEALTALSSDGANNAR